MQIVLVFKTIGYEIDLGTKSATHDSVYRFSITKVWYEKKAVVTAKLLIAWFPIKWYRQHKAMHKKMRTQTFKK